MASRSTQPLIYGGLPSFPLSTDPYNSRVEEQELSWATNSDGLIGRNAKNYQFIGFRPGFPLQASELNEMQEHFQMQMSLYISMMHNWITSGPGPLWSGYDSSSAGNEGSTSWDTLDSPATGIGVGGGINAQTNAVEHNPQFAISAPGWIGACPLYPYNGPYIGTNFNSTAQNGKMVSVTQSGNSITVNVHPGWWLVEPRYYYNGDGIGPIDTDGTDLSGVSGMKHWMFVETGEQAGVPPSQWSVTVSTSNNQSEDIVVGLVAGTDYYTCCPEDQGTDNRPCDPLLADNATNSEPDGIACGASRFGIKSTGISSVDLAEMSAAGDVVDQDRQRLSLFCKINPAQKTVRYMNNLLIHKWT